MLSYFTQRLQRLPIRVKCWPKPDSRSANHTIGKMKIFQTVQENMSHLGISQYCSMQKNPINWRNMSVLLLQIVSTVMYCMYLFYVAATFKEYTESAYVCMLKFATTIIFTILLWRMQKLFDCLNRIEEITNEREFFCSKFP